MGSLQLHAGFWHTPPQLPPGLADLLPLLSVPSVCLQLLSLLIKVRIETQRGEPSKELFSESDKLILSDLLASGQETFWVVGGKNSAIRCAKSPFLVKILLASFIHFRKHTHTSQSISGQTIMLRMIFLLN